MFTNSSPKNLIKPHHLCTNPSSSLLNHPTQCANRFCDCARNHTCTCTDHAGNVKGSFCVCSSCGKTYENSGDSLSDFDTSVDSVGIGGHRCPNSPSVRGFISDADGMHISLYNIFMYSVWLNLMIRLVCSHTFYFLLRLS